MNERFDSIDKAITAIGTRSATGADAAPVKSRYEIPAPLDSAEYKKVNFWKKRLYTSKQGKSKGITDGNATSLKKRGRPGRQSDNEELNESADPNATHTYPETEEGIPVSWATLARMSQKARSIFQTLASWGI